MGTKSRLKPYQRARGVAKNTIKRYLEYLEAAFLIKRVDRIDQTAKRLKRAMCFKAYLTNLSMRAALFGPITADAETIGHLIETAILSQWQHSDSVQLYYARWNSGEIDIVYLDSATQSPQWVVEVKWSDRPVTDPSLLRHCVEFATTHPALQQSILCTTKTYLGVAYCQNVLFNFQPSSLYAYTLGANLLNHKNTSLADVSEFYDLSKMSNSTI